MNIINAKVVSMRPMANSVRITIDVPHADSGSVVAAINADYQIGLTIPKPKPKPMPMPKVDAVAQPPQNPKTPPPPTPTPLEEAIARGASDTPAAAPETEQPVIILAAPPPPIEPAPAPAAQQPAEPAQAATDDLNIPEFLQRAPVVGSPFAKPMV